MSFNRELVIVKPSAQSSHTAQVFDATVADMLHLLGQIFSSPTIASNRPGPDSGIQSSQF